jgi:hypothetical protein
MVFIHAFRCAEVAELVDALGSGSSARTGVGVRISPSAPMKSLGFSEFCQIRKPFFYVYASDWEMGVGFNNKTQYSRALNFRLYCAIYLDKAS